MSFLSSIMLRNNATPINKKIIIHTINIEYVLVFFEFDSFASVASYFETNVCSSWFVSLDFSKS